MKIKPYAVSVQWGEGYHYFLSYYDTLVDAITEAAIQESKHNKKFLRRGSKGAAPKVHVWHLENLIKERKELE